MGNSLRLLQVMRCQEDGDPFLLVEFSDLQATVRASPMYGLA